jgi:hypothetical protein
MRPVVSVSALTWFIRYIYYCNIQFLICNCYSPSPSLICDRFWLSCLGPLGLLLSNILKLFGFPFFRFWAYLMKWSLFQKRAVRTWWNEGYSRNAPCALNLISTFVLPVLFLLWLFKAITILHLKIIFYIKDKRIKWLFCRITIKMWLTVPITIIVPRVLISMCYGKQSNSITLLPIF